MCENRDKVGVEIEEEKGFVSIFMKLPGKCNIQRIVTKSSLISLCNLRL